MTTLTASPLMAITIFEDVQGTKSEQINGSWDGLVRMLESPSEYPCKERCRLIKLATFGDERSRQGSLRTNANMLAITGVEGDYDGGKVSPEEAAARLKAANVEAIIYTTPSHTTEKPRWRVLAPLSKPHAPNQREELVALLNGALGGILNVESFTPSQCFYFGKVKDVEYEFYRTHGLPLDELYLVLPSIGKNHTAREADEGFDQMSGDERASDQELIRQICIGENYHHALLILSARYHHRGMNETAIIETLHGFMLAHKDNSGRWQNRYNDIPRMVNGAVQKWQKQGSQVAYQLLNANDLAARPPLSWCIKGVLPKTGLVAIFGPSGSGKSFVVIDLAMALASGSPWFGIRTKACPVIYCALEGEGGVAQRVAAYRARYGNAGEQVRYLLQPVNLLGATDVSALAKAIADTGCAGGVTILDTLNRAAPGSDENDSRDMGLIIAAAKSLQVLIGGLVLLVHHTGKDVTKGLRGHSSLLAALDCAIEIIRAGDRRSWCIAKSKDGLDGNAHPFRLDVVELGIDEDGDQITSCVIVPETVTAGEVQKVKITRGGNQKIILKAIRELLKSDTTFDTEKWPKSATGRPCIELEHAVAKICDRLTCVADQRSRSTRNAITGLVNTGLLALEEGWLWEA